MKRFPLALLLLSLLLAMSTNVFAEDADTLTYLLEGKTTQAFTDGAIPQEDLETILLAGVNTQSAMNSQPWHFTVLDGDTMADLGGTGAAPASAATKAGLSDAPAAIVISCSDTLKWNAFDAGAACARMAVAANALGYGSKVVAGPCDTINASADYKALCGIHEDMNAIAILLIGNTAEEVDGASGATQRNPFDEVVTYTANFSNLQK